MKEFTGKTFAGTRIVGVRGNSGSMILALVGDDDGECLSDEAPVISLAAESVSALREWIEKTDAELRKQPGISPTSETS